MVFTLDVDGEQFAIRQGEYGGTDYDWLTGPNKSYGFSSSGTPNRPVEEHRESIRAFLAMIDPDTGYIEDEPACGDLGGEAEPDVVDGLAGVPCGCLRGLDGLESRRGVTALRGDVVRVDPQEDQRILGPGQLG